jgi:hypothetical protein
MLNSKYICQPVTALFDISRDQVDGRTIDMYLSWLSKTISIFPDVLVFHDGSCDQISHLTPNLIKLDREIIFDSQLANRLKVLFSKINVDAPNDITFKIPAYSLVQFLKFELLTKSLQLRPASSYLWIDAGISRFISFQSDRKILESNSISAIAQGFKFIFEIDLKHNINFANFSIKQAPPGTCRRIVSGTSFWVKNDQVKVLNQIINERKSEWLKAGNWDNDQVMLRGILNLLNNVLFLPQGKNLTGSVARFLSQENQKINKFQNNFIHWLLKKDVY